MAKKLSKIFGVVFVIVAALGFAMKGNIFGIFQTGPVHDVVHLVSGIALFALAGVAALRVFGVVYLAVAALGFAMGPGLLLGVLHVNAADNWLHLVLGVVILAASMLGSSSSAPAAPASPAPMA